MLGAIGGRWPTWFWTSVVLTILAREFGARFGVWWLGHWAQQYQGHDASEVNALG
jgi:hypothetical protein